MSLHALGFALLIAGFWAGVGALAMVLVLVASAVSYAKRERPLYDIGPTFVVRGVVVE